MSSPDNFSTIEALHDQYKTKLYFKEGDRAAVEQSQNFLKTLKIDGYLFFSPNAFLDSPLFHEIKIHVLNLSKYYKKQVDKLEFLFMKKILPFEVFPFSLKRCRNVSLMTVNLILTMKDDKPYYPVAYVDLSLNLVAKFANSTLCLPLEDDCLKIIQYKDVKPYSLQEFKEKNGRQVQLFTMLTMLQAESTLDVKVMFSNALAHDSLCFAIAMLFLFDEREYVDALIQIFIFENKLDHLVRSLCSMLCPLFINHHPIKRCEFYALNKLIFAKSWPSFPRAELSPELRVKRILESLWRDEVSRYFLKCLFVVCCYYDGTGDTAKAALIEVIFSFLELENEEYKMKILLNEENISRDFEEFIITILQGQRGEARIPIAAEQKESHLELLYEFATNPKNTGNLVDVILHIQEKGISNPIIQTLFLSYHQA